MIPLAYDDDLVLVPAKEAGCFRHRPAVGEFVHQVTDIHPRRDRPIITALPRIVF
jgi:hypothetical protein